MRLEQARASQAVKFLQDGTDAGALRVELAEAKAALLSCQQEAAIASLDDGNDAANSALADGHDIDYWHRIAIDVRESYWQRTIENKKLSEEIEGLKAELSLLAEGRNKKHPGGRPVVYGAEMVEKVKKLRADGVTIRDISKQMRIATGTVQRLLKK